MSHLKLKSLLNKTSTLEHKVFYVTPIVEYPMFVFLALSNKSSSHNNGVNERKATILGREAWFITIF